LRVNNEKFILKGNLYIDKILIAKFIHSVLNKLIKDNYDDIVDIILLSINHLPHGISCNYQW